MGEDFNNMCHVNVILNVDICLYSPWNVMHEKGLSCNDMFFFGKSRIQWILDKMYSIVDHYHFLACEDATKVSILSSPW